MTSVLKRPTITPARVIVAALLVGLPVVLGIPAVRTPILRAAGSALVVSDSLHPADVIVVSVGAGGEGVLEAADLVASGIASRVAVFVDPPANEDLEFIRRGLPYEDRAARAMAQLRLLGVQNIIRIPMSVSGTEEEGRVLPGWVSGQRFRSVIVVTTADHSRRVRRIVRRAMAGHSATVSVRSSRYSTFKPETWWHSRTGLRTGLIEMQKLLVDMILHPFPA